MLICWLVSDVEGAGGVGGCFRYYLTIQHSAGTDFAECGKNLFQIWQCFCLQNCLWHCTMWPPCVSENERYPGHSWQSATREKMKKVAASQSDLVPCWGMFVSIEQEALWNKETEGSMFPLAGSRRLFDIFITFEKNMGPGIAAPDTLLTNHTCGVQTWCLLSKGSNML